MKMLRIVVCLLTLCYSASAADVDNWATRAYVGDFLTAGGYITNGQPAVTLSGTASVARIQVTSTDYLRVMQGPQFSGDAYFARDVGDEWLLLSWNTDIPAYPDSLSHRETTDGVQINPKVSWVTNQTATGDSYQGGTEEYNVVLEDGTKYSIAVTNSDALQGYAAADFVGTNAWQSYTGSVSPVCFSDPVDTLSGSRSNVVWIIMDTPKDFVATGVLSNARVGVSTSFWVWAYTTNDGYTITNGVICSLPVSNRFYSAAIGPVTVPKHSRVGVLWQHAVDTITNATTQLLGYE